MSLNFEDIVEQNKCFMHKSLFLKKIYLSYLHGLNKILFKQILHDF